MQPLPFLPEPVHRGIANQDLDVGAGGSHETGRFERALPRADDEHVLVLESRELALLGGVRDERGREIAEHVGTIGKRLNAAGDDDAPCNHCISGVEQKPVTAAIEIEARDLRRFRGDGEVFVDPASVPDEVADRHGIIERVESMRRAVHVEAEASVRVRDAGRHPWRSKKHRLGHVALPERHGLAEESDVEPFDMLEMRGGRKPVRTCADDRDITRVHKRVAPW